MKGLLTKRYGVVFGFQSTTSPPAVQQENGRQHDNHGQQDGRAEVIELLEGAHAGIVCQSLDPHQQNGAASKGVCHLQASSLKPHTAASALWPDSAFMDFRSATASRLWLLDDASIRNTCTVSETDFA